MLCFRAGRGREEVICGNDKNVRVRAINCKSLTSLHLVNFIDVTLACEDSNSKLVEVVNVANVDDEDRVGNSLLHTWELRLGNRAKLLFRLSAQGFVKVLKLKFRQDS